MDQHSFETAILRMWTTTRIPMTRANVQAYTGARRDRMDPWLDALGSAEIVEIDSDDDGELVWTVRGSVRPSSGPRTVGEAEALERLRREIDKNDDRRIEVRATPARVSRSNDPVVPDSKSLIASGLLSFFFGPLGWVYAAPLREALPATLAYLVVCSLLPHALIGAILGITAPFTALAGIAYAWRYNQNGRRMPLLVAGTPELPPKRKR